MGVVVDPGSDERCRRQVSGLFVAMGFQDVDDDQAHAGQAGGGDAYLLFCAKTEPVAGLDDPAAQGITLDCVLDVTLG